MIKEKIRVLVVEDSRLYQEYLRRIIESDACLAVAGIADCGRRALEMIPDLKPDIITLDLQLPDTDDFALLETILHTWSIPVIVVSGDAGACEKAIELGARDFIEKVQSAEAKSSEQFRLLLKLKLKMQAESRQEACRRRNAGNTEPAAKAAENGLRKEKAPHFRERAGGEDPREHLIVIGASLGGTETTLQLLQYLPDDLPGIVIVQHLPADFTRAYALRLDHFCGLTVREAKNGDPVLPGTALVAKGGVQLTVCRAEKGFRIRTGGTEKVGGFSPSVDVLFRSAAEAAGPAALGVILTGMGRDGAAGMKYMHDRGSYTLGQDRESCAVFGMPGAAWNLGGVDRLLPPEALAREIVRYCFKYKKSEGDRR